MWLELQILIGPCYFRVIDKVVPKGKLGICLAMVSIGKFDVYADVPYTTHTIYSTETDDS